MSRPSPRVRVATVLSIADIEALDAASALEEVSRANLIRKAVRSYLRCMAAKLQAEATAA